MRTVSNFFFESDTGRIMFGMLLAIFLGVLANVFLPQSTIDTINNGSLSTGTIGTMFINSMKMLVVFLIFLAIVEGMTGMSGGKQFGRIFRKTIIFFMLTTSVAIVMALGVGLILDIGSSANLPMPKEGAFEAQEAPGLGTVILNIVPSNIANAFTTGNNLAIILFAVLIGLAVSRQDESNTIKANIADWNTVILDVVQLLMKVAPIGVFALMFKAVSAQGWDTIKNVLVYLVVCTGVLVAHAIITYGLLLKLNGFTIAQIKTFYRKIRPVLITGFSTSSSNATMPTTLKVAEQELGVKKTVCGFTIPMGGTINMDGTSVMQGLATVFIANIYGIDLTMQQYALVIATALLASVGTAGVPGVGLIMLGMVLSVVNVPVEQMSDAFYYSIL